ncbi:hypothetical protein INT43_003537 [Umbelopsis isabellina]|uniref:THUMP domain-containing protein n=1 Tax=Mortierella isabellina TaxID=91625 RepID=A0A8H7UHY5_MORIS|nr:hypothetical protein INT43_003537 [Umbelopsis isabellina]
MEKAVDKRRLSCEDHSDSLESASSKKLKGSDATEESPATDAQATELNAPAKSDNKQRKNTTPIHRGKFKSRWLSKHSSLLKRSRNANGLLISCVVGCETRALGQVQQFLLHYIPKLFPDHKTIWDRVDEELDVDESFITERTDDEAQKEKDDKADNVEKKDKLIEAVDCGCSGLLFLRFRVDVLPTVFISTLIDYLKSLSAEDRRREIQKTSHCSRWIPIDNICNSFLEDISKTFDVMKQTYFTNEQTLQQKVAIVCEVRNNERLNKQDIIKTVAPLLPTTLKVDLKSPDIVIFVSVFKSVCGMSILPKYYELKKYNIPNICESVPE